MNQDSIRRSSSVPAARTEPDLDDLFVRASQGTITPLEFYAALAGAGVTGPRKTLYTRDAFGLTLEQAKGIAAQVDCVV